MFLEDIYDEELGMAPRKKAKAKAKAKPSRPAPKPRAAKARQAPKPKARPKARPKPAPVKKVARPKPSPKPKKAVKKAPKPFLAPTRKLSESILNLPKPAFEVEKILAPAPELEPEVTEEAQPEEQAPEESEEQSDSSDGSESSDEQPSDDEQAEQSAESSDDDSGASLEDLLIPSPGMKGASIPAELKAKILELASRADKLAAQKLAKAKTKPQDQRSKFKLQIFSKLKDLSSAMPVTSPTRMNVNKRIILACSPYQSDE